MNTTIASMTARALLGRRRVLLLLPMPVLLIGLTIFVNALDPPTREWVPILLGNLGLAVILPLTALIIGSSVLGLEIEDGTITHVLAKPLPRGEIVVAKVFVAWVVTAAASAVPLAIAGAIAESGRLAIGLACGAVVGALAYSSVFVALSVLSRRPVAIGLIYIMLWENLLVQFADGAAYLSVQQYALALADAIAPGTFTAEVAGVAAAVLAAMVIAGASYTATARLRSFTLTGTTA